MSQINVDSIANSTADGPVYFPHGMRGDASNLIYEPKVLYYDPVPLTTGVSTTTNITVTFDQQIQFAGVGTIYIREGSANGSIATSFTCGVSTGATIAGETLIINPPQPLGYSTSYYVTLPSVGIANTFGAMYKGTTAYFFQTRPAVFEFSADGGQYVHTLASPTSPTGYYKYHIFTGAGILTTYTPSITTDLQFLMVGGGGAGGYSAPYPSGTIEGGGGGAGGVISRTGPTLNLSAGIYNIEVGAGGVRNTSPSPLGGFTGGPGGDTKISTPTTDILTAFGGGGGGGSNPSGTSYPGRPGGSGGGGHYLPQSSGGTGTPGQGNNGQNASTLLTAPPPGYNPNPSLASWSGGGGGAGSSGSSGNGGPGTPNPAFPSSVISGYLPSPAAPPDTLAAIGPTGLYGGGGSGAYRAYVDFNTATLVGGPGGGGRWPQPSMPIATKPATMSLGKALTGGGGAGGYSDSTGGNNGGSGIVMLRYAVPAP